MSTTARPLSADSEIVIERAAPAGVVATRTGFRLSWGAVLAGLVLATALQLVLSTLGAAVGLAAFDPGSSARAFGIGTALWAIGSLLVALFLGGSTTGRLAGRLSRVDAFLHGALLWALFTLLTIWLLSRGVGAVTGTAFRALGNVTGAVASTAANVVGAGATAAAGAAVSAGRGDGDGDGDAGDLRRQLTELLRQTGDPSLRPDSLGADARAAGRTATQGPADNGAAVDEIETLVRDRARNIDRTDIVNIIAARTGRSRAEAEQLADRATQAANDARARLSQTAQQVTQTVRTEGPRVAEDVASGASTGLWFALLGMGLGLVAAVFGTRRTAPE